MLLHILSMWFPEVTDHSDPPSEDTVLTQAEPMRAFPDFWTWDQNEWSAFISGGEAWGTSTKSGHGSNEVQHVQWSTGTLRERNPQVPLNLLFQRLWKLMTSSTSLESHCPCSLILSCCVVVTYVKWFWLIQRMPWELDLQKNKSAFMIQSTSLRVRGCSLVSRLWVTCPVLHWWSFGQIQFDDRRCHTQSN